MISTPLPRGAPEDPASRLLPPGLSDRRVLTPDEEPSSGPLFRVRPDVHDRSVRKFAG